jgi:predicted TIM-barrel enzyme
MDGLIVGSRFKKGGKGESLVEGNRVKGFVRKSKPLTGARLK